MKKFYLSLFLLISLVYACSTDFDLTTGGEEIASIYGLVDKGDPIHYIRVEKLFVSEDTAPAILAKEEQEVYFESIDVEFIKNGESIMMELEDVSNLGLERVEGDFLNAPNYLFKLSSSQANIEDGDEVSIVVKDRATQDVIASSEAIKIVETQNLTLPGSSLLSIVPSRNRTIQLAQSDNAAIYNVSFLITVRETRGLEQKDSIYRWDVIKNSLDNSMSFSGASFYRFLARNLEVDDDISRSIPKVDIIIAAGGSDLARYIEVTNANTGITSSQVIPNYSNINNGVGLLSSTLIDTFTDFVLTPVTKDSLRTSPITSELNFRF